MTDAAVGFGIGVVTALMNVAGIKLLFPMLVLVFGADVKLARSLSLAVSLPTIRVGLALWLGQSFPVTTGNLRAC